MAARVAVAEGGRVGGTVVKVGDSVLVGAAATCCVGCVDGPGTFAFEPLHQGTMDKGPDAGQRLKATIKMAARTHNPSRPPTMVTGISMLNLFPPAPSGVFEGWAIRVLPGAILVRAAAIRVAERWAEENRAAIAAYNQRIEAAGVFSDGLRAF